MTLVVMRVAGLVGFGILVTPPTVAFFIQYVFQQFGRNA
jgi:hypothetical protein